MYKSPPKPILEFIKMINNEVPTACFMGKFAKNNKAGMIKIHHQPRNPVTIPTETYYAQLCVICFCWLEIFFFESLYGCGYHKD
jgi:hypothetical protein